MMGSPNRPMVSTPGDFQEVAEPVPAGLTMPHAPKSAVGVPTHISRYRAGGWSPEALSDMPALPPEWTRSGGR